MRPQDVWDRLDKIAEVSHDDERAHSWEDALHQDVLAAIAGGARQPRKLAELALRTRDMEFARWCA